MQATAHGSPETVEMQREEIRRNPSFLRRMALRGIHYGAGLADTQIQDMFFGPYERVGLGRLGIGYDSTAVTDGSSVWKIHRASRDMNRLEQDRLVGELRDLIEVNMDTHPEQSIPTNVRITTDPLNRAGTTVVLEQELLLRDKERPYDADVQEAAFATRSLESMLPLGHLPDVHGTGNLLYVDGKLKLVDTVSKRKQVNLRAFDTQERMLRKMIIQKDDASAGTVTNI